MKRLDVILQPLPLALVAFGLMCVAVVFGSGAAVVGAEGGLSPLAVWIDSLCGGWSLVFSLLLATLSATALTRLIMRYSLSVVRSLLPLVLYGIWLLGVGFCASPALHLALFLMIGSLERLIMSFKREERFGEVMCSAVYATLAVMLVPDAVWAFVPLMVVQWVSFRRSSREILSALLAMVSVVAVVSFAWWVPSGDALAFLRLWSESLTPLAAGGFYVLGVIYDLGVAAAVLLLLLVLLTLLSAAIYASRYGTMRLRARKVHNHFLLLFVVGLLLFLCGSPWGVAIMAVGSVTLLHTFFAYCPGLQTVLLYVLLLVLALL